MKISLSPKSTRLMYLVQSCMVDVAQNSLNGYTNAGLSSTELPAFNLVLCRHDFD
jgi:hypothetical protein